MFKTVKLLPNLSLALDTISPSPLFVGGPLRFFKAHLPARVGNLAASLANYTRQVVSKLFER